VPPCDSTTPGLFLTKQLVKDHESHVGPRAILSLLTNPAHLTTYQLFQKTSFDILAGSLLILPKAHHNPPSGAKSGRSSKKEKEEGEKKTWSCIHNI
jgi:hypothetical protein